MKLVDDTSFSIPPGTPINTKVFVFGKQHNDVRFVDYDAVSMLNVSATQALAKKVEALEAENDRLKVHQTKLGAQEFEKMDAQNAKITALEAENAKVRGEADRLTTIEGEEKAKMVALETEVASLKAMSAEMATLKQAVANLQIKDDTIHPVALNQ